MSERNDLKEVIQRHKGTIPVVFFAGILTAVLVYASGYGAVVSLAVGAIIFVIAPLIILFITFFNIGMD